MLKAVIRTLLLTFTLLALFSPVTGAAETIDLINVNEMIHVGPHSWYYVDYGNNLSAETVIADLSKRELPWLKSNQKNLSFGFTTNPHWIYFQVDCVNSDCGEYVLELDYPHLDIIDFYILSQNKIFDVIHSGDTRPFFNRELFYRNFTYKIRAKNKTVQCLLKIQGNGSITVPIYIWEDRAFHKKMNTETLILGMYYGLLCIIIIFNILLFLSIRNINYIYYTLWVIGFGGYQFAINGLGFQFIWPKVPFINNKIVPVLVFFGITWAYQFGRSFLVTRENFPRVDSILKLMPKFMALGALLSFLLPYRIAIRAGVISVVILSTTMLLLSSGALFKGIRTARFYVLACSFLFIGVAIYALKSAGILPETPFTTWAQMVGSLFEMITLSVALTDRINLINKEKNHAIEIRSRELTKHNEELNRINSEITLSEERYRILIEGAEDIIFTMSENYIIHTINTQSKLLLKLKPEQLINHSLLEFIYVDPNDNLEVSKKYVKNRVDHLVETKEKVTFKAEFTSPIKSEPLSLKVRLEYNTLGDRNEIVGRASSVQDDSLMKYFISEKQKFAVDNHLMTVEDITYRITRNLTKYIDITGIKLIRTGLREVLFNAIEHGNLGITFKEKSRSMIEGNYFQLLASRQNSPGNKNKKVSIEYSITPKLVKYSIIDEGPGFDHRHMMKNATVEANEKMLMHGRGLTITSKIFDSVTFNDRGNHITLTKRITPSSPQ